MSILKELTKFIARNGGVKGIFVEHWKPKLICLALAVLVWLWVEYRYVQPMDQGSGFFSPDSSTSPMKHPLPPL